MLAAAAQIEQRDEELAQLRSEGKESIEQVEKLISERKEFEVALQLLKAEAKQLEAGKSDSKSLADMISRLDSKLMSETLIVVDNLDMAHTKGWRLGSLTDTLQSISGGNYRSQIIMIKKVMEMLFSSEEFMKALKSSKIELPDVKNDT
ncbi:hypothetical protein ACFL9U_05700 [Thermodesulfobacteriota bacterium]